MTIVGTTLKQPTYGIKVGPRPGIAPGIGTIYQIYPRFGPNATAAQIQTDLLARDGVTWDNYYDMQELVGAAAIIDKIGANNLNPVNNPILHVGTPFAGRFGHRQTVNVGMQFAGAAAAVYDLDAVTSGMFAGDFRFQTGGGGSQRDVFGKRGGGTPRYVCFVVSATGFVRIQAHDGVLLVSNTGTIDVRLRWARIVWRLNRATNVLESGVVRGIANHGAADFEHRSSSIVGLGTLVNPSTWRIGASGTLSAGYTVPEFSCVLGANAEVGNVLTIARRSWKGV